MTNDRLSFLSNRGKGIQVSEKRLKLFKYFRKSSTLVGSVFLQDTHASVDIYKKSGTTIFKVKCFFHTIKQIRMKSP